MKKKKMNKLPPAFKIVVIIVCFVLIFVSLYSLSHSKLYTSCQKIEKIHSTIKIVDSKYKLIGLNADKNNLSFGEVSPFSTVKRSININNDKKTLVRVSMEGNFSDWVEINPSEIKLKANQSEEILFTVNVPGNASQGYYIGNATFCFK